MSVEANSSVPVRSEDESEYLSSEDEETVEVHGFRVRVSQENQLKEMLNNHPDLSSDFNLQIHQNFKNAYMDVLLDVVETLSHSTNVLSRKDILKVRLLILPLEVAGFKVDWLIKRWNESYLKKEKQRLIGARIKKLEKLINKQKLKLSDLESDLKREKAAFAAVEA